MRDIVEVALDVYVYDMAVALPQESFDVPQGVFTTASGPETVAACRKFALEDGFNHQFHCALHDAIPYRGNPQRSFLTAAKFRYMDPSDWLGLVTAFS